MPPNKFGLQPKQILRIKEKDNVIGLFGLGLESGDSVPDLIDAI